MPSDTIVNLIFSSIYSAQSLKFLDFVNINSQELNMLVTPATNDKIILINSIKECLSLVFDDAAISNIIKTIIDVYNETPVLKYTELDDINFYSVLTNKTDIVPKKLTFLPEHCVANIINALQTNKSLPENEFYLFKVQMFIYASLWFDMDGYLKYLYHLYK